MNIHFIIHESFEAPGALETWAKKNNHAISYTRVYQYDALPAHCDDIDLLIVLGGPQSPTTTKDECPYFDAQAEMALIRQANQANKLVLGVCLGAQLIGEAFGAACEPSPNKEIGVFAIQLTDAGKRDPLLNGLPVGLPVGHWHGDMPGLTESASILAYSDGCPRQIIRYADNVYGFQCHLEFTRDLVSDLIIHSAHELANAEGNPYVHDQQTLMAQDYSTMNRWLFGFLDNFTDDANRRDWQ